MKWYLDRRSALTIGACGVLGLRAGASPQGSVKKGFCFDPSKIPDWRARLELLHAHWFYTWGIEMPKGVPPGIEFIPMIWGQWTCSQATIKTLVSQQHKTLLGFNEPEQQNQSNMTVAMALELWPILMESGMRLGSPAGVHPDGEWMTSFMKEADRRHYRIDFIAIHAYMGDNPNHFLARLERIHALYKKPLWITEFAVADWNATADQPNKYSSDEVCKFMEIVLPALEKLDYVERYSWYSSPYLFHPLAASVLFNADGSLNRLGKLYSSF